MFECACLCNDLSEYIYMCEGAFWLSLCVKECVALGVCLCLNGRIYSGCWCVSECTCLCVRAHVCVWLCVCLCVDVSAYVWLWVCV